MSSRRIQVITSEMSDGGDLDPKEFVIHTDFPLGNGSIHDVYRRDQLVGEEAIQFLVLERFWEEHHKGVDSIATTRYSIRVKIGYLFEMEPAISALCKVVHNSCLLPLGFIEDPSSTDRLKIYVKKDPTELTQP